jgi:hypothetical protein
MRPQALVAAVLVTVLAFSAGDAAASKRVRYEPPPGFAGYTWGQPRTAFARLPAQPFNTGAAWIMPVVTDFYLTCGFHCDADSYQRSYMERREGGGFYVLSEYTVDGQGFQWGGDPRVQFFPVVYQFCANWWSTKKAKPENFDEINKFCGMKFSFRSETTDELRALVPDHVTTYDLVLDKLVARFGKPDSFVRRGTVTIESAEAESFIHGPDRKFRTYRWCPAFDRRFHTECDASVVLTLKPETGEGTLLYSTPALWEYAYARKNSGYKTEPLYRILHARR